MRDALNRLILILDLVGRIGDWFIGKLYQLRDGVAEILQLHRIIPAAPWLFSALLFPDAFSLSRVLAALSLLIWNPAINSAHANGVIIWGGLSDWLDGYIAKLAQKAGIRVWGLNRLWPMATGNAVDSGADGLAVLLATLYLVVNYPHVATWLLLIAVMVDFSKVPAAIHGYYLVKNDQSHETVLVKVIRKERIGEAKMLCLFVSVIMTCVGLSHQNQRLLLLATFLTGVSIVLSYLTTARYVKRFLDEFPNLTARWYRLPRPTFTWLMILIFLKFDVSRRYPIPPTN